MGSGWLPESARPSAEAPRDWQLTTEQPGPIMSNRMSKDTVTAALRAQIAASEHSLTEIARLAKVDVSSLSRFCRGERGLHSDAVDALASLFGLELVKRRGSRKEK
jgi:hypothetical protein